MSTPAEILATLEHCARIFGPPAPRPPQTDDQILAQMLDEHRAEIRKAERQEMSDWEARRVA